MVKLQSKPDLRKRTLISGSTVERLADLFQVLANDTRPRVRHALAIRDELSTSDLADSVGMKTGAISNQLQKLSLSAMERRFSGTRAESERD